MDGATQALATFGKPVVTMKLTRLPERSCELQSEFHEPRASSQIPQAKNEVWKNGGRGGKTLRVPNHFSLSSAAHLSCYVPRESTLEYVRTFDMNCFEKFPKLPPKGLQCLHLRSRASPIHQSERLSYKKNSKITKTQAIKRPAYTGRLRSITLVYSSSRRSPRKFYRGVHRFVPEGQTTV